MQPRIVLSALAGLAMAASGAFAETTAPTPPPAPPGPMMHMKHFDKADMEKHMARMCQDHYAKAVGKLAELEVKLDLTAKQKPLYERWKGNLLSAAKDRVNDCTTMKMPDHDMSLVDHMKMHAKMLQAHLDIIKAQMPALEALNGSLSDEQQKTFKHSAMEMVMEKRMGMMMKFRMHGDHGDHGMMRHHGGDDDDMPAPPPPPAN